MNLEFIETNVFSRSREKYFSDKEFRLFELMLLENPEAGDLIVGTGGCRKVRRGRQGMGKSGGLRVIYYHICKRSRLYLLLVYPKSKSENLTETQKQALRAVISELE